MSKENTVKTEDKNAGLTVSTADIQDASLPTTEVDSYSGDSEIAMPIERGKSAPITRDDIILPTLRLAHNVGSLGEDFQKGSYVVDGQTQVTQFFPKDNRSTQIELTVLEITKSFVENVPYPQVGKRLYDDKVVASEGKTIEYWTDDAGNRQPPHYFPTLDLRILVKRPTAELETLDENGDKQKGEVPTLSFPFSYAGEDYAMLAWTLQRSGYSRAGKRILSAFANKVFACPHCGRFLLGSSMNEFNSNKTFVPELQYGAKHDEEFVDWCATLV
jgi:hypothetical protein